MAIIMIKRFSVVLVRIVNGCCLLFTEGYWASYNVPFYPAIKELSGHRRLVDEYGPRLSHELCPRARIFRRDQHTVVNMRSMQALMRYNSMYLGQVIYQSFDTIVQPSGCLSVRPVRASFLRTKKQKIVFYGHSHFGVSRPDNVSLSAFRLVQ